MLNQPEMTAAQASAIRKLVRYAAEHVPFYQTLFEMIGLSPDDIQSAADVRSIPHVTKQDITAEWSRFTSDEYLGREHELIARYTSGSTGAPLKIVKTKLERVISGRHLMSARARCGLRLPVRWAGVGGRGDGSGSFGDQAFLQRRGKDSVLRLSHLNFSEATLQEYAHALEDFQPTWIYAMPSTIDCLAQVVLAQGRPLTLHNLQLIELAAEYLAPDVRKRVWQAFGFSPVNQYGSQEVWGIAFECNNGGMHVLDKNVYLEVVKEDGTPAGYYEPGEVVVTALHFRAMPFLRYRLGDFVIRLPGTCTCGNPQPLLQMIGGRVSDIIVGHPRKIGNLIFDAIMKHLQTSYSLTIQEYRLVQRSPRHFEVLIVGSTMWDDHIKAAFVTQAWASIGPGLSFDFKSLSELPPHESGKNRPFVIDLWEQ
jgi:phenylacetate-CoA ligase